MSLLTNLSTTMQLSIVQLEFQIDDNSPLIVYDPPDAWQQVNSSSDPFVKLYYGETLTRASAPGAQAHFSFNGTGFAVYGGRKKQYAPFELKLDGRSFTCDASTSDDPQAAVRLCSKYNLTNTNHTATLISSTRAPFDIDKISWTTEMNSQHGRTPLETLTVDDADSAFTWDPPTAWTANPADLNRFRGSTGHSTATLGGSVTLKFKVQALMNRDHYSCRETHFHHPGEIVSIFGSIGPENAPYTAQIDGRPIKTYNATTDYRTTRSLLFFADNLGPGDHAVTLTNAQDRGDAVLLEVDYAEVQQFMPNAVVPVIPSASSTTVHTESPSRRPSAPTTIILAAVFGAIVISVLLWSLWYLWRRKRAKYVRLQDQMKIDNQFDWASPSQLPTLHSSDPNTSAHKGYAYHQTSESMTSLLHTLHRRSESLPSDTSSALRPLRLSAKIFPGRNRRFTRSPLVVNLANCEPSSETIELSEEDYGHIPVPGELPPPTYLQATAPSGWRFGNLRASLFPNSR